MLILLLALLGDCSNCPTCGVKNAESSATASRSDNSLSALPNPTSHRCGLEAGVFPRRRTTAICDGAGDGHALPATASKDARRSLVSRRSASGNCSQGLCQRPSEHSAMPVVRANAVGHRNGIALSRRTVPDADSSPCRRRCRLAFHARRAQTSCGRALDRLSRCARWRT
jgi:hypothetical protein